MYGMALRTTWSRRCSGRRRRWRTRGGRSTSRGCERRGARGDGVASRVLGFVIDFLRQGSYASQYLQFHTHTHTRRFSLHSGRPPTDRFSHSPPRRRVVVASRHVLLPHVLLPHRRRGLVAPTSSITIFTVSHTHVETASTPVARRHTDSASLLLHDASSSHHDASYFHTATAVSSHQPPPPPGL